MNIGYACLALGVPDTDIRHCVLKNASNERLSQLIDQNLDSLNRMIDYNIENGIKLFRISSDLIPFGSNPVNTLLWWREHERKFHEIGNKIKEAGIRISMHPGQYTVLNSPDPAVVERAVQDLIYHARILDCLNSGTENKIILHIGGVYQDKKQSAMRFAQNYKCLPETVKQRLVIENDDKSYHICDVIKISQELGIPVIFDNLHHALHPPEKQNPENFWIDICRLTWLAKDGVQKIHYSQQDSTKKKGSHSSSVDTPSFMDFCANLGREDIDIMLEVKDKNLSAVKCINCLSNDKTIKVLEKEWERYKYSVLEKSPLGYVEIRRLLKDKSAYPAIQFYHIIENALLLPETTGNAMNAAQHIWGYFKDIATLSEKEAFLKKAGQYQSGEIPLQSVKNFLWRLAGKYQQPYLLQSYYFVF